jgi:hypothetical protein
MNDVPLRIDEAEAAGWQWLETVCRCGMVQLPWHMLRKRTKRRALADIIPRMRCEKCHEQPRSFALGKLAYAHQTGKPSTERLPRA